MNIFKLLLAATFALSTNAAASDELTPAEKFTVLKNSSYLSSLEKKRTLALAERDNREQVRQYMEFKQYASK